MKIGYARVSTNDQNLDRQRDQLRNEGCGRIYEEKQSGKDRERPELKRMLDSLREGDIVVVSDLTRVSRSVKDLFEIVEAIHVAGAEIKSLHEPWLDTTSPQGRLLFTIFSGISEFERELIRQRTLEGLESARARGHMGGRPTLDPKLVNHALRMYDKKSFTIAEIKDSTGVSKSALYRYLRERNESTHLETPSAP